MGEERTWTGLYLEHRKSYATLFNSEVTAENAERFVQLLFVTYVAAKQDGITVHDLTHREGEVR